MPNTKRIVINTSPLLALIAAWDNLSPLSHLYDEVFVPFEVCQEIELGGKLRFGVLEFQQANFLQKQSAYLEISPFLLNSLDLGEASVIQLAQNLKINTVCIDEIVGRRIARLNGLMLTGSIGILLKYKKQNPEFLIKRSIAKMLEKNIRLSEKVINFALKQAQE